MIDETTELADDGSPKSGGLAKFSGRAEFRASLRSLFERAAQEGWSEMVWSDPNFADWTLGERATIDLLNQWAGHGRRLILLAGRYDVLMQGHARFVAWRKTWDHVLACRQSRSADPGSTPSAIWGRSAMLQRNDVERCVGVLSDDPGRRLRLRQELDEWLAESMPAFPASTLGL